MRHWLQIVELIRKGQQMRVPVLHQRASNGGEAVGHARQDKFNRNIWRFRFLRIRSPWPPVWVREYHLLLRAMPVRWRLSMNKNMWRLPIVIAAASFCAACATEPELLRIEGVHQTIVVHSGLVEPTYSLETRNGRVIIPAMTLSELQASHPDLHKRVTTMRAKTAWAGM